MQIRIILTTIIDNINFGTYLQAYATVSIFQKKECTIDVLNYIRPYLTGKTYAQNYLKQKNKPLPIRYLYFSSYLLLNSFMIWQVKRFLKQRVTLTERFNSLDEIIKKLRPYDLYLTGSDQVWNSEHNFGVDKVFFWEGISKKKAAYGASIGIKHFPKEQQPLIRHLLSDYKKISVRECSNIQTLAEIGIKNAVQVLDPTLLLKKEDWISVSRHHFKKKVPYLLIYSVETQRNSTVINIAKEIAVRRNLAVYLVCPTFKFNSQFKIDKIFNCASVEMFLSLFEQADYIVVSSFHGTAFAINFNKQFVTVSPERFSTRVNSLLQLFHLENQYISNKEQIPDKEIDYTRVNQILEIERCKSESFIDDIINIANQQMTI